MVVINFADTELYVNGLIIAKGVNIIHNSPLTEADQNQELGIGENALRHYNFLSVFWDSKGFYIDSNSTTIKGLDMQIQSISEQMKGLARERAALGGDDIKTIMSKLNQQKNKKINMLKAFYGKMTLQPLNDNDISIIETLFESTQSHNFPFKQSKYAVLAMETIRSTKKQALPYQLYKIKSKYGF